MNSDCEQVFNWEGAEVQDPFAESICFFWLEIVFKFAAQDTLEKLCVTLKSWILLIQLYDSGEHNLLNFFSLVKQLLVFSLSS